MNDTTAKELDRLADWLRAQGMTPAQGAPMLQEVKAGMMQLLTPAQVLDCLKYIAGTTPPTASAGK